MMVYLDYASTTPLRKEILKTYTQLLETMYANSDSLHDMGRDAMKLMEQSRARIAQLFHVQNEEILFTSGASEANNYAIKAYALANQKRGKHIIASNVEHSSVAHSLQQLESEFGFEVTYLAVNRQGVVALQDVKQALRDDTILVSCMLVNNETGAMNPLEAIADYVHTHSRAIVHSDCVQALGKIPVDVSYLDLASFSAHKIYGLKGSGFLFRRKNITLLPWISAGQQEYGLRGGTSNAPACTVLAKTIRMAIEEQPHAFAHVKLLYNALRKHCEQIEGVDINSPEDGSCFIFNISLRNVGSEIALNALNAKGFAVSAQSTCASRSKALSKVILAMGFGEERSAHALRISLSHMTTMQEIDALIHALKEIIKKYGTK